jgi:guanosine-3',5'-bis(diphosphate) 3'-pyrophosphohydrolase
MEIKIDLEQEKKDILSKYRGLLLASKRSKTREDKRAIRKAFDVALEAHKDMRRKSGEPYIYHPIAVARIVAEEIGLGTTAIVCALLHDTVEDTDITLEDIEVLFGEKEKKIIDGLTKISGVFDNTSSLQAENFRKMLLTLSDDVRVILIKLADRLHNMRTLESMRHDKQLKIASETIYLYAPLAHRLGLYAIKSELEDLSLKYKESELFDEITHKLKKTQAVRTRFINQFKLPIVRELERQGVSFEVKSRTKSVYSIWNKVQNKKIPFEEIYDLFAIRIIIDGNPENEKADCWKVYSLVTDFYQPNPDRLRDWVSTPKANGYESLHTTVMSPTGKWVEVQIRSRRMDEIAEKGYAAHWKYKESNNSTESSLDSWLGRIRESLENIEDNALDFIDDFKLNLFSDEIFVFTPSGDLKTLPKNATALDFAFEIHTQVGSSCIGAKVNKRLVPLSHGLKSGDQIEILTSKKQRPKEDWLKFVTTARAKAKIKNVLKDEKKKISDDGKEILMRKLSHLKIDFTPENITILEQIYNLKNSQELFYRITLERLDLKLLKTLTVEGGKIVLPKQKRAKNKGIDEILAKSKGASNKLVIGEEQQELDYSLSACCKPIPGDRVFGFVTVSDGIKIHRNNCPNATQLMSNYAYRIVKAQWHSDELVEFMAGVKFTGIDDVGLVYNITNTISQELSVNMQSISFESNDGIFEGEVMLFVHDTDHLSSLIKKLKNVPGVLTVVRIDAE